MIVEIYLVDEKVWNKEMERLKLAQPPKKEPLPTKTIPPNLFENGSERRPSGHLRKV